MRTQKMNKVAITGMGAVSAAGKDIKDILSSFKNGERNAVTPTVFKTSLVYPVFEARSVPSQKDKISRTISLAMVAVKEALVGAGLSGTLKGKRVGVCLGTTVASQLNDIDFYRVFKETQSVCMQKVDRFVKSNLAEAVSQVTGADGPSITVVNACSSGADAIGIAVSWINGGICDIAIAGGADELECVPLCGFRSLGIVSDELCAPFDKDRKGLNLGEGAGIIILEGEDNAIRREVKPKGFVAGYGAMSDAYHLTAPHPEGVGLEAAINIALKQGGIKAEGVAFINAHGTATHDNDKVEAKVLKRVFGSKIDFFSTKGYTGHTLGAAGGLEAVFTASALNAGEVPMSAGFKEIDEEIGLAPVTEKKQIDKKYAVSTSLAFGGNNAALLFEKAE
jgi:3-oxoacyl-[acyl-carrier-protein] synthase II